MTRYQLLMNGKHGLITNRKYAVAMTELRKAIQDRNFDQTRLDQIVQTIAMYICDAYEQDVRKAISTFF